MRLFGVQRRLSFPSLPLKGQNAAADYSVRQAGVAFDFMYSALPSRAFSEGESI